MFEILAWLIGGIFAVSFVQDLLGGNASDPKKRKNSSLLKTATSHLDKYNLEQKYCGWFKLFERDVAFALKWAEETVERHRELDANPRLKNLYEEVLSNWDNSEQGKLPEATPDWVRKGKPVLPVTGSTPEANCEVAAKYQEHLVLHRAFVKATHEKLSKDPKLERQFQENLGKMGLHDLECYFFVPEYAFPKRPHKPADKHIIQAERIPVSIVSGNSHKSVQVKHPARSPRRVRDAQIQNEATERKIPHLAHFTRCDNIPSILQNGLKSVATCQAERLKAIHNDKMRLDGHLDATSLSVTFPNYRMFFKYRQLEPSVDWAVLLLSPRILWELDCGFYRHNAADSRVRHMLREEVGTAEAFHRMFEANCEPRDGWLRNCDPTDPQAEVLVFETIKPELIETVVFETKQVAAKWDKQLKGIDRIFAGPGNGLFGSRKNVRLN